MIKPSILLLSWRDYYNPKKGGAEVFDYEILKRLAIEGYKVVWLAPKFDGCSDVEEKEGITYIRMGKFYNIHLLAIKFLHKYSSLFDIVIDELHGYPFFTNLYLNKPKVTIVHEVAGEIWFKMMKFPISFFGYLFEKFFYKLLINHKFLAPSNSTKEDLINQGIKSKNIFIIDEGSNTNRVKSLNYKKNDYQICFVGRICKMKGIADLITAFSLVQEKVPQSNLVLVGKVDKLYENELYSLINKYNLKDKVKVTGFVDDLEKEDYMKQSKYLVSCSVKEGFGLIIVEANSLGTPAITYNVNGYRDIIKNNITGYLVEKGNIDALSKRIIQSLNENNAKYKGIQKNSFIESKKYNWDSVSKKFEDMIQEVISSYNQSNNRSNTISKFIVKFIFLISNLVGNIASKLKVI